MRFSKVSKYFKEGNVCVVGLRGTGKDLLFGNVIARQKKPYISNVNYGGWCNPFNYQLLSLNGNYYPNFITGDIKTYTYPYADGTDLYLSDVGVYFPSQYCGELNKKYPQLPTYFALSRQLGHANCHINTQALGRAWDKIREQSDTYIVCMKCHYIFGFVIQKIRIYDREESAKNKIPRLSLPKPLFEKKEAKLHRRTQEELYKANHGTIRYATLFYRNKSKHDTRAFRDILKGEQNETAL